ncbi:cobyric acid synthase [Caldisalinibacter kiritimatiensis]|uniref:Cobyric acid synthase n=1 Tax=Caldisalinibacter kiritimatiensis TaxID=1304284 RepID=R1CPY6_9FIRM|nr:cobyric acid synthase [Caldisalinibacter kiritimatiensis]EOD00746.1 Cobyric acid synthase [Caldisalinibacter kiritimatiensis]
MAKNIMLQGTASSVGKSVLTAALCRILNSEGLKVTPFKSQNMALNSFVTFDGKEIGRAQAVQAEAARIQPRVEMNPVLLKPTSDIGSQVIINGVVYKNMKASEYYQEKDSIKKIILDSYNKLDLEFDAIVIEGAGSSAEINLRHNDIVNMGLAEMVNSPVILVGDIDKGGVFASIYGTIMLLSEEDRDRIKGFIINKFRGDIEILNPGIKKIEELVKKPCLGVVPYIEINIDDEDSVTTRFHNSSDGEIIIGVIKTPYISNFSDFTPLELEKGVSVKYVYNKQQFEDVDLIILPGSKNTINDLRHILDNELDKEIYKKHKQGIPIIGICGGYQMLGLEIKDPYCVESSIERINGLGLLDIKTTMLKKKSTRQVNGKTLNYLKEFNIRENEQVTGYEIHMGDTNIVGTSKPVIELKDGRLDGAVNEDGNVLGTYLHGVFDNDSFRRNIISMLRKKKNSKNYNCLQNYKDFKEREYDKLADAVRKNVNIEAIKKIMGL